MNGSAVLTIILGFIVLATIAAGAYLQVNTGDVPDALWGLGGVAVGSLGTIQVPTIREAKEAAAVAAAPA